MDYDVIVIGGGIAGMTAARRAQQLGKKVIVLDKANPRSPDVIDPGSNSRISGGLFHAAYHDPRKHGPDELYADLTKKTDGTARPDVVRAWADNALRALDFLVSEGAEVKKYSEIEMGANGIMPPMTAAYELEWAGRGPDKLLTGMDEAFESAGGTRRHSVRAVELGVDRGTVTGVMIENEKGARELVSGRAVVMADGGYQANPELVRKHIGGAYLVNGTSFDTGDCLRMATAIGARGYNLRNFYGHIRVRDDGAPRERVLRHPGVRDVVNAAMVVGGDGRRVGDETFGEPEGVEVIADAIARSATPGECWVVFDDAIWEGICRQGAIPPNPTLRNTRGPIKDGATIAALAKAMGVPTDALEQSVSAFNRFCTDGTPLNPPRTERVTPIMKAPFHAIAIITSVTFTMGGVLVNGKAEVLGAGDVPIPGLYAAGGTIGGLQGGPRNGYSGGWSQATTFGLISAESAARFAEAQGKAAAASR